ncbi:hypothetical protein AURDEDRAFT_162761 [Auricularia subglabra TFB-10046 SS5]|nr:hypothetical protein AURDEDRAFT_162761 [Auricularia subglabra TFB-10046 SS5]
MEIVSVPDSLGDETAAMVDEVPAPTATPRDTSPGPHFALSAQAVAHATPRLPPRAATAWDTLQTFNSPRPQFAPQPSINWWAGSSTVPAPSPLSVASPSPGRLMEMRDELAGATSFWAFRTLAISGAEWRELAAQTPKLDFSAGSHVTDADMRADLLYELAPGLVDLTLHFPVSPSLEPSRTPRLKRLCLNEANGAVWSGNRELVTLNALHAQDVRNLEVRNASQETIHECAGYLGRIIDSTFVDDGETRHIELIDQQKRTHSYDGPLISATSFLFARQQMRHVTRLTLNETMLVAEIALRFGDGGPPQLNVLEIWFGAVFSLLGPRTELLAYRGSVPSSCKSLATLRLTMTPPLAGISPRDAAPRTPLPRAVIEGFLCHVRGRESVLGRDVRLELDGIAVEGYDAGCANPP